MPSTRLISASLLVKPLPSRKACPKLESAERRSSRRRIGAIVSAQLVSAKAVKNPSDRKMAQIKRPTKSGSPATAMCVVADPLHAPEPAPQRQSQQREPRALQQDHREGTERHTPAPSASAEDCGRRRKRSSRPGPRPAIASATLLQHAARRTRQHSRAARLRPRDSACRWRSRPKNPVDKLQESSELAASR